jgi:(p)ppGpp synthase/HD superfamily hydrolase
MTAPPPWLKQLGELQKTVEDPKQFLKNLKTDFFDERVFAFTPKGEVVDLPVGARPVDFAYAIHSDLGNHMSGVKINGKLASIDTELKNGDIIDIETKKSSHPTQKWLEHAMTTFAKRKIRQSLEKRS